jgi:ketosteroid isomerase-like protein
MTSLTVDLPHVVADVRKCFLRYDDALTAHDLVALETFFWDDPRAVRYGVRENLHGRAEIDAFRRKQGGGPGPAQLSNTVIATFGEDFASVCTQFVRTGRRGRQSQAWVRQDGSWRIVSAHISELGDA